VATLVATAEDESGPLVRCSVCGRDSRGFPGASGPTLRCVDPPQHRHLVLPLPINDDRVRVATVGRSDLMHWPERSSATNAISRSHLRIRRDGGRYLLEDLSTNGTALRGEELRRGEPAEVRDGDLIGLVTTGPKPVLVLEFCLPHERGASGDGGGSVGACPNCAAAIQPGWAACPECGTMLSSPPSAAVEAPATFEVVEEVPAPARAPATPAPEAVARTVGGSLPSPSSEVEPVALPDGDAPRVSRARGPEPREPHAPRPAPSRQRESELDAEQLEGPPSSDPAFEEGLAALLRKAKGPEGRAEPPKKPTAK